MSNIGGMLAHPTSYVAFVGAMINPLNYIGGGVKFNPDKDIPDLTDKVILITGGISHT